MLLGGGLTFASMGKDRGQAAKRVDPNSPCLLLYSSKKREGKGQEFRLKESLKVLPGWSAIYLVILIID